VNAFFVIFCTSMGRGAVASKRRKLATLLRRRGVGLVSIRAGGAPDAALARLVREARGAPVIAIDDRQPLPSRAPWVAALAREAGDLADRRRPILIYVSRLGCAAGEAEGLGQGLVRHYIKRDDGDIWVGKAAEYVRAIAERPSTGAARPPEPLPGTPSDIVGSSPCFLEAVGELWNLMRSPYGLVTGDPGVGKILTVRALWRQMKPKERMTVLPCGSFFKDYYVGGSLRQFGGGRAAVNELRPYIREAHDGLLVLHHVEQLPTALQEELDGELSPVSNVPEEKVRLGTPDEEGILEYDVKIIATSTYSPELLAQPGRMIPDLLAKFRKRHVRIPSLEERGAQDKRLLCEDILARITRRGGSPAVPALDGAVVQALCRTVWPNNISDLVRVLEHAVYRSHGGTVRLEHLPKDMAAAARGPQTLDEIIDQAQRAAIERAIEQAGSVAGAAALLHRNTPALYRLVKRLGVATPRQRRAGA